MFFPFYGRRSTVPLEKQTLCLSRPLFGLKTAPRVLTKLLKPVVAYFRKWGVRVMLYLDDFLILVLLFRKYNNTQLWL